MHTQDKLWTRYKKAKTQLPLLRCQEQKQGPAHDPCTQHHQGGEQTTTQATPPAWPMNPPLPSPYLKDQLAVPSGSEQGKLLLVFTPSCCSWSPNKAFPQFLVWPLINFYWLRSPRTQVSNGNRELIKKLFACYSYLGSVSSGRLLDLGHGKANIIYH